jgi:hypothetical protein
MTSLGLVSLWNILLAPLNYFARIYEIICHYNSFYSTMTHLLHNDSTEYSIRIFCILWLYLGCVRLHNDSLEYSFKFFYYILVYGNFAYVSRGFSIKGQPNLAQDSSSIFFQNHHQWFPPLILKSFSTMEYTDYLTQSILIELTTHL